MSSYVQSVIGPGEKIEYEGKVSVWSMVPLFILGSILLPAYGLGLLFWLSAYLRYISTELAITDKKIIAKFGFIKRESIELLLPKVETIQVKQSMLGRMLNYGSIVVSGAGTPQAPVPGISHPIDFRRAFMDVKERLGSST